MNVVLNPLQGDTKDGAITLLSNSNLTGKENNLLKIVNNNGVAYFDLPAAAADQAIYICGSGGAQGAETAAEAPALDGNCRVFIDAACNPGDQLALSKNNWGQLTKPAAGYGAGFYTFVAEEAAAAGGSVKVRRVPDRAFNI
jgi:hypothetical protein